MLQFLNRFFAKGSDPHIVAALYGALMTQAREPMLFSQLGVPDQFENRFELLTLHMFLVLERLKREGAAGRALSQELTEFMVSDLDRSAREAGVGDVGVVKRMKAFMSGFYGRLLAYEKAFSAADDKEVLRALDRNLYGNVNTDIPRLTAMRSYLDKQRVALTDQSFADISKGQLHFAY